MSERASYHGIDSFRIIAAFLVVAIHTSPLAHADSTANFILTGVIARVAVPFFFMASGFFIQKGRSGKPWSFLRKTALLYAAAIVLYLPLNVYHGIPEKWTSIGGILKDVFFAGTYLHLWYLPAAMTGAVVSWLLLRRFKVKGALIIALVLYVIGLLGDSYYGFADRIPFLKSFYSTVFEVAGHTRNGLLTAPVFFILGAMSARRQKRLGLKTCLAGLGLSLALLAAEGLLLNAAHLQWHDSMYVMLIPCMVFLFESLLHWNGRDIAYMRDIPMVVYIVHPMAIVLVNKFAVYAKLEWLSGGIARFLIVCAVSFAAAVLFAMLPRGKRQEDVSTGRAWAEIDLNSLAHNARALRAALPEGCDIMAVVKADAYGHGSIETARALGREGIRAFAVATLDEGIDLRRGGVKGEILILGYTDPRRAAEICRYKLSQTIVDAEYARELDSFGRTLKAHIKVDTGMHRLGESYDHVDGIQEMFSCKHIYINGIFTHLCVSDSAEPGDKAFTKLQEERFVALLGQLKERGITIPKTHVASSYGVLNGCGAGGGWARTGIALYGAANVESGGQHIDLKPVLSLKARVAQVRTIKAGESAGYGRIFTAREDTRLAVLTIGYADGVPRNLSCGNGCVLIRGRRAPIVGSICMDQLTVDVTDIPQVTRGDIATLIGRDGGEEITAVQAAQNAGTIPNELLSRLGGRLEREYIKPE